VSIRSTGFFVDTADAADETIFTVADVAVAGLIFKPETTDTTIFTLANIAVNTNVFTITSILLVPEVGFFIF